MSKGKRKAERAERRRLKLLEGGGEPNAPPPSDPFGAPLEGRPEFVAHMRAWRDAGEPPGPSVGSR